VTTNAKTSPDSITLDGTAVIPPCNVAILGADSYDWMLDVKDKLMSYGHFKTVDLLDVSEGPVPTLDTLQEYDAILVYSDSEFYDSAGLGDVLADYVDAGGGVVMATCAFNLPDATGGMKGRIYDDGYMPFSVGQIYHGDLLTMVVDEPDSPILQGVNSFNGGSSSYHEDIYLTNGATLVAHWDNNLPLIAYTEPGKGRVVGLNFFPVSDAMIDTFWDSSTDGMTLMGNALMFAGRCYMGE
jgi:hypothetical protein